MPRCPDNNTLTPLLRKLSASLGESQAKNELRWLLQHVRTKLGDTGGSSASPHQHQSARLWREQPAPSALEIERSSVRLGSVQWSWLRQAVADRTERHKPLQYIIGEQQFGNLSIGVRPPVLIPRWETEEWMLRLAGLINAHTDAASDGALPKSATAPRPLNILDACTGSGCIALGLGSELAENSARIVGVDISQDAVGLAQDNLAFNRTLLSNHVEFRMLDLQQPPDALLAQLPVGESLHGCWDMIVSNPPYVTPAEYCKLDPDVKDWEDIRALVPMPPGTADPHHVPSEKLDPTGILFVVRLAKLAKELGLVGSDRSDAELPNAATLPRLVVEIGGGHQVEPVCQAMHDQGFNMTEVWKDMAGTDRVVLGYFKK